jgi:hypothetical protein
MPSGHPCQKCPGPCWPEPIRGHWTWGTCFSCANVAGANVLQSRIRQRRSVPAVCRPSSIGTHPRRPAPTQQDSGTTRSPLRCGAAAITADQTRNQPRITAALQSATSEEYGATGRSSARRVGFATHVWTPWSRSWITPSTCFFLRCATVALAVTAPAGPVSTHAAKPGCYKGRKIG